MEKNGNSMSRLIEFMFNRFKIEKASCETFVPVLNIKILKHEDHKVHHRTRRIFLSANNHLWLLESVLVLFI